MTSFHVQPGNPQLAAELRAQGEGAAHEHADRVRAERGLPDEVLDRILDDMFLIGCRVDGWSSDHARKSGAGRLARNEKAA